jgi:spore coat polysaccharide biosynthesis protein SpsF
MKIVAIVQARMGSTRLPGKVLMDLGGKTVLARVVARLRRAILIDQIVVATTDSVIDNAIIRECQRLQVEYFRGSENDVLDRYYQAANSCEAQIVVRITADCPLIDAEVVDDVIRVLLSRGDYASNTLARTYPRGLDAEVFTIAALERAWQDAHEPHQREHVTPYFYEHTEIFELTSLRGRIDYSRYRWTLDTAEDLELLRTIYARLDNRDDFHWLRAVRVMEDEPDLAERNVHVVQKALQGA